MRSLNRKKPNSRNEWNDTTEKKEKEERVHRE